MAETTLPAELLWVVILAAGVGTFAIRLSFIHLFGKLDDVPLLVERALRLVPAAVLAALVVPGLVFVDGALALSLGNERLLAGAVAAVIAWRTENVLATITVGMVALWLFQWL